MGLTPLQAAQLINFCVLKNLYMRITDSGLSVVLLKCDDVSKACREHCRKCWWLTVALLLCCSSSPRVS